MLKMEVGIVLVIVVLLGLVGVAGYHKESVEMPEAYRAWVKQTGNPKELTFEEWRALKRADERDGTTVVPVIIPIR